MAVTEAPDGIRVGTTDNGRFAMYDFDEYVLSANIGSLTAGETKLLDFGECPTFRGGQNLLANLVDPPNSNGDKLLILHTWVQGHMSGPATVQMYVKNVHSSTIDFSEPQFTIGGWNTSEPA